LETNKEKNMKMRTVILAVCASTLALAASSGAVAGKVLMRSNVYNEYTVEPLIKQSGKKGGAHLPKNQNQKAGSGTTSPTVFNHKFKRLITTPQ
jgi:hypothetical protein